MEDDLPRDLRAGPGHPICADCNELVGPPSGDGACSCKCGNTRTSAPPAVAKRVSRSLVAMMAQAPRAARGAIVGLTCPSCSAPLDVPKDHDGKSAVVTCKYCQRSSVVDLSGGPRTERVDEPVLWLLFRPSVSG